MSESYPNEKGRNTIFAVTLMASVALTSCNKNEGGNESDRIVVQEPSDQESQPDSFSGECNFDIDGDLQLLSNGEAVGVAPFIVKTNGGDVIVRPIYDKSAKGLYAAQLDGEAAKLEKVADIENVKEIFIPQENPGVKSRQQRRPFDGCVTLEKDEKYMAPQSQAVYPEGDTVEFNNKKYPTFINLGEGVVNLTTENLSEFYKNGTFGAKLANEDQKALDKYFNSVPGDILQQ